ncbi:12107_t:CDS:1, partial [Entrophospora sp. SA101]
CCSNPELTIFIGGSDHTNKNASYFENWINVSLPGAVYSHVKKFSGK